MRNGERRQIGNATVVCHVIRRSWKRREDRMGAMAPCYSTSSTWYDVVGPNGKSVLGCNEIVDRYAAAVARARTV